MQTKQKLKYKRKLPKANFGLDPRSLDNMNKAGANPEEESGGTMDAAGKGMGIASSVLQGVSSFMPQDNNDGIGITHKGSAISKGVSGGLKTAAAATQSIPILSGALGIGSALTDMVTGWVDKIREKDPTKVSRLARKGYEDSYSNVGYSFGLPQGKYGLPLFKSGGNPIYTSDPNDPRIQKYKDSLTLSILSEKINPIQEDILKKGAQKYYYDRNEVNTELNQRLKAADAIFGKKHIDAKKRLKAEPQYFTPEYRIFKTRDGDEYGFINSKWKKPVQPVIFQKEIAVPEPKVNFLNNVPLQEEMTKKDLLGIVQHPEAPSENKQPFKGNFFYQKRPNGGFNVYQNGKRVGYSPTQQSKDIRPDEDSFDFSKKNYIKGEPQFKNGGDPQPIYTSDKNDPRLRAYNDSLSLYKAYEFQKQNYKPGYEAWLKDVGKSYPGGVDALRKEREKNIGKPLSKQFFDKDDKKSHFKSSIPDSYYDPLTPQEYPIIDYYKSLIGNDKNYRIGMHNSPDLWHKNINPIGSYYDGASSPIYKKPVQPVIYKEREQPRNIEKLEAAGTTKMAIDNPEVNLNKKETSSGKYTVNTQDNSYSIPNKALFDIIVKKGMPKKSWESNGSGGATFDMSDETFFNNIGEYKKTFELGGDPRHLADIEAEKGEALQRGNKIIPIGGNTHQNGGTPLNVQPNDKYIYSDTLGLDSDGKISINPKTVTQTFATLAKRTENKYKGKSDDLSLKTKDLELKMLTSKAEEARVLKEQTDEMKIMKKYKARYGADLKKFANSGYTQFGVRPIGKTPSEEDDILTIQKRMIQNNPNALPKFGADGTWGDESKKEFANYSANAKSMVPAPVTGINNNTGLTPFSFNQKNYLDWIKSTPEYLDKDSGLQDLTSDKAKSVFRPMYAEHIYNQYGAEGYNTVNSEFMKRDKTQDSSKIRYGVDQDTNVKYSYIDPKGVKHTFITNNISTPSYGKIDDELSNSRKWILGDSIPTLPTIESQYKDDVDFYSNLSAAQKAKVRSVSGPAEGDLNRKTQNGLFQNLSQGDKIQLAGMIPAVAYNLGMGLRKSEVEQAKKNPYESNILNMMANRKFDMQPYLNEANLANNVAREDIGNNSTSVGGKVANLQKLYANNLNALQSLTAKEQEVNNNYRAEEANVKNTLGENARREEIRISDINAQNRATKQNFLGKAAQQIGQGINTLGRGANQSLTNQMQIKAMSELSPDYDIKPLRELYKSGQVDENGLLEFNGNKYIYDPKRDVATYVGPSTAAAAPTNQSKSPYSPIPFSLNFTNSTRAKKGR